MNDVSSLLPAVDREHAVKSENVVRLASWAAPLRRHCSRTVSFHTFLFPDLQSSALETPPAGRPYPISRSGALPAPSGAEANGDKWRHLKTGAPLYSVSLAGQDLKQGESRLNVALRQVRTTTRATANRLMHYYLVCQV